MDCFSESIDVVSIMPLSTSRLCISVVSLVFLDLASLTWLGLGSFLASLRFASLTWLFRSDLLSPC
jgi:hypothetical protein